MYDSNLDLVGKRFEDLSPEEMDYIVGGDGASPMSTPITSLTAVSAIWTSAATVSLSISLISYTVNH